MRERPFNNVPYLGIPVANAGIHDFLAVLGCLTQESVTLGSIACYCMN